MYDQTTIEKALQKEGENYKFFKFVFNRVKTIYFRGEDNEKPLDDQEFEEMFYGKTIDDLSAVKKLFSNEIIKYPQNIEFKTDTAPTYMSNRRIYILNYFAVDAILSSYRYCFRKENKNNTTQLLLYANDNHDYLMDVMESLAMLEDLVSRSYTDVVATYFENKAVETTNMKNKEHQRNGGIKKAENERKRNEEIRKKVIKAYSDPRSEQKERWKSLASFALHITLKLNKGKTQENEMLKIATVERWIREYTAQKSESASRKAKLVAEESKY